MRKVGPIINHNIIMVPEPDQPTPTPSSDQADCDSTVATIHNTGKRSKKGEMEDLFGVIPRKSSFLEANPVLHAHLRLELSSKWMLQDWGTYLHAQHDDSSNSSTGRSGFAQKSSIDCSRMVNQSESSCKICFICYKVGPWSEYSRCMLTTK